MYEQSVVAVLLMLYLIAINPPTRQLLQKNLQSIAPLTQLPSTEIKLLSKALIARLIPADIANYDMAVLALIEADEVDCLMNTLISVQSYKTIPTLSVIVDLSRSPHNMWALASKDVALKLSDIMENMSKADESKAAQLIWRMMELNYKGSEEVSIITNNGTLQEESFSVEGMIVTDMMNDVL